ncbi:uncharacterized protein GIQ15_01767 [Arthroderma uncinatum]|uniref:uncharacterized protein n=1 Tax=Arthroderma uncinatum TaxID=74035 RepID=UPI00144AE37C|nr:uncharacterized protein GIQ15_01767 [Arthroderma uncinatum]KAF3492250.1 hypothetical protein GIQ15_01767 [Arthroderma uncinatum]
MATLVALVPQRDRKPEDTTSETSKWVRKDRYRMIGDRGRWQRKTNKEAMRLAKMEDVVEEEEGEGEGEECEHPKSASKKRLSDVEFEKEMKYIQRDRVALAARVKQLLGLGYEDKALQLVIECEKAKIDCIASWNELMAHTMRCGKKKDAMKLLNDMKKRGRFPNEQTFTTLLSGLATGPSNSLSRSKHDSENAIRLFESMSNANSVSKPNIIHINAVLNVCARNGDMANLWKFAGEIPEHGECAPNSITYTIILNAIRTSVIEFTDTLDPNEGPRPAREIVRRKRIAVSSGKKLWGEIIRKWRKGDLVLDSKLVTAMARLLAIEDGESSYFDVFSLYTQCMGLPIPTAIQPDITRLRSIQNEIPKNDEFLSKEEKKAKEEERKMLEHLFDPIDLEEIRTALKEKHKAGKNPEVSFPSPTNAELELLITLCQNIEKNGMASGRHYWTILTSNEEGGGKVKPDSGSCHEYLRLLRRHRASAEALRIIQNHMVPEKLLSRKTFIIALSICSRDRNNQNVLDTASKLLDISASTMEPEPSLTLRYIELVKALLVRERLISDAKRLSKDMVKRSIKDTPPSPAQLHQTRLLKAVTHLRPRIEDAMELLAFGYIKYNKKPTKVAADNALLSNEGESAGILSTTTIEEEANAMAKKAVSKLKSESHIGRGKSIRGPDPYELLQLLFLSLGLYRRILGSQSIPSPSDPSPDSSSVSSFLSDSDRGWLSKGCERLSMFTPYFKKFGYKANEDNELEADGVVEQDEGV